MQPGSLARPDRGPRRRARTTTFAYDDAGGTRNLLSATDTLGRAHSFAYDARGNLTSTSDGTTTQSFVFDGANRLTESRDALGNATTLRYTHEGCGCTERDLVTGVHTPDLAAGVEWALSYGAEGRLASVTDFTSTTAPTASQCSRPTRAMR